MYVRFQPKAWYDEEQCELYALREMKDITAKARAAKEESMVVFDNLSGQTTETHKKNLMKNKCRRHLLPGGMTDELQLVDDGIGYAVKNKMGKLMDYWLVEPGNLEKWTSEGGGAKGFAMWEKRVLITQLAAKAWEEVCASFDFEAAATRLGMRMTVDGSGDQFIKIQGVPDYKFCDADGGDVGAESDDEGLVAEEENDANADITLPPDSSDEEEEGEGEEDVESEEEEEDDTAELVASLIGNAVAPEGYTIIEDLGPLDSEADLVKLIGMPILCGLETRQAMGWFVGTVHSRSLSSTDKKKTPTANFVVKFKKSVTKNKNVDGCVAVELTERTHGPGVWWVLLQKS